MSSPATGYITANHRSALSAGFVRDERRAMSGRAKTSGRVSDRTVIMHISQLASSSPTSLRSSGLTLDRRRRLPTARESGNFLMTCWGDFFLAAAGL